MAKKSSYRWRDFGYEATDGERDCARCGITFSPSEDYHKLCRRCSRRAPKRKTKE